MTRQPLVHPDILHGEIDVRGIGGKTTISLSLFLFGSKGALYSLLYRNITVLTFRCQHPHVQNEQVMHAACGILTLLTCRHEVLMYGGNIFKSDKYILLTSSDEKKTISRSLLSAITFESQHKCVLKQLQMKRFLILLYFGGAKLQRICSKGSSLHMQSKIFQIRSSMRPIEAGKYQREMDDIHHHSEQRIFSMKTTTVRRSVSEVVEH